MEASVITPQHNLLERTVTEMKSSVRLFVSASRGESEELDNMLSSMMSQLDSDAATFTFSQLVEQFKRRKNQLVLDNADSTRQSRIELIQSIKNASRKELSTSQVDLLNNLIDSARSENVCNEELLRRFGETLLTISDDIELSRNSAKTVVDSNHEHIKQNKADIVASDIQTASRRLARELSYLSKKLSKSYPSDKELLDIKGRADELKEKNNQFFSSLDLLSDLNNHVSNLIARERVQTQGMLIDIQARIFDVFNHSKDLESSFDESSDNSSNLDSALKSRLESLKRQADNSDNIHDLQSIIEDSISSLSDAIDAFSERQRKIDNKNKEKIKQLNLEIESANEKISDVKEQLDSKEQESSVDELSRVGNRKGYLEKIRTSHDAWKSGKQKLSLVVLDVDKFKSINDKYGHTVGDQVIRKIATIIKDNIGENDYIARYGGEEFVIICNDYALIDAAKLSEKIRKDICKRKFRLRNSEEHITVSASFGVAEFTSQRKDVVAVFNAADKGMYEAKSKGRNKVVVAHNNKLIPITKEKNND